MKSFNSVVAVLFLSAMLIQNSHAQVGNYWYQTSFSPVSNSPFNIYTGVDDDDDVQFVVSGNATGVFKSTDIGANWVNIGLNGVTLTGFYDNPDNSGEYVVTASTGVYITTDGGTTWPQHNSGIEGIFITDVIKSYDTYYIGTVGNGVYQSTDGGMTWQQYGTGLENKTVSKVQVINMTQNDDGIYAIVQGEGVYALNFATGIWGPINDGIPNSINTTAITSDNQNKLFLANFDFGVYSSPADPVFWQLEINFQFANDIIGTEDGEVFASSLGNGVIKRDLLGNWTDFLSGLPEINGYIDVVNIALDKPRISASVQHLWAAVNPLEPGGTPGIYRTVTPITDVEDNSIVTPEDFRLEQNYPNPFNPTTKIKYTIPSNVKSEMSNIMLKVFDVLGNEIATLVNEEKPAGTYEVEFNTSTINHIPSSGIYFYQLRAGSFIETKKMILMK